MARNSRAPLSRSVKLWDLIRWRRESSSNRKWLRYSLWAVWPARASCSQQRGHSKNYQRARSSRCATHFGPIRPRQRTKIFRRLVASENSKTLLGRLRPRRLGAGVAVTVPHQKRRLHGFGKVVIHDAERGLTGKEAA